MNNRALMIDNCNKAKNKNIGKFNQGDKNIGSCNQGNYNLGNDNTGDRNRGNNNIGNLNCGDWNFGDGNCGDANFGYFNCGDDNYGDCNCGDCNQGDNNRGNWNKCDNALGSFNTKPSYIYLFNKPTTLTWEQFTDLPVCSLLRQMPMSISILGEEKEEFLEICWSDNQKWWVDLLPDEKQLILSLPNFDKEIFKEITHIDVTEENNS